MTCRKTKKLKEIKVIWYILGSGKTTDSHTLMVTGELMTFTVSGLFDIIILI